MATPRVDANIVPARRSHSRKNTSDGSTKLMDAVSSPSRTAGSSTRSPEASFTSSPPSSEPANRSRTSSFTDKLGQGLEKLFRSPKPRKQRSKYFKDKSARPSQPNVLEKQSTNKLTKFWDSVDSGDSDAILRAGLDPSFQSQPSFESRPPFGIELPTLASIPEDAASSGHIRFALRKEKPLPDLPKMDPSRLAPQSLDGEKKQIAIQDAKDMYEFVQRACKRTGRPVPPYDFLELIGKGGFARVYKCKEQKTGDLVAVKVINTDDHDYAQSYMDKDDTIKDFRKEVAILQQLKDARARNINIIHDAFDFEEQLWIVSEYCTGGSIRTLMRARPASQAGLEEHYIIPIARELAIAIKSVHDIGVIHRDIKCTNVYVTEEGDIQLGDFGIVGVMDDGVEKRQTVVGTPHYLPREMQTWNGPGNLALEKYGTEIDIWSFGCSVYEMATGQPPNATTDARILGTVLLEGAPRLQGGNYSQELRDFIAFCLTSEPENRPTVDEVLKHPYIANSQKKYPTRSLAQLINRYKEWEYEGGWRQSLFWAGGAPPVSGRGAPDAESQEDQFDDWNFSTSDSYNAAFEKRYSQVVANRNSSRLQLNTGNNGLLQPIITKDLTPLEQLRQRVKDLSADRGERSLDRLWNPKSSPYELHTPVDEASLQMSDFQTPDLPLRAHGDAPTRESLIDLDSIGGMEAGMPNFNFDFEDIPTLKARTSRVPSRDDEEEDDYQYGRHDDDREKRATMEWTFASAQTAKRATMAWEFPKRQPLEADDPSASMTLSHPDDGNGLPPGFRPALKHTTTEPIGQFRDYMHPKQPVFPAGGSPVRESMRSMIDLDIGFDDPADIPRPGTASSATGSTMTDMTSGNPFDLEEDPEQNEIDRNRFSYHKQWQSEGGHQMRRSSHRSIPMHSRGNSLSSTASDLERPSTADSDVFTYEYNHALSDTMRSQMNGSFTDEAPGMDQWPNFAREDGFDKVRGYIDPLDEMVHRQRELSAARQYPENVNGSSRPSTAGDALPQLEFPRLMAPHPEVLLEEADPRDVMLELNRLLDDFDNSLKATAKALQLHAGLEREDNASEMEETGAQATGDDEGF